MTINKNVPWIITAFLVLLFFWQTIRLTRKLGEARNQITESQLEKQVLRETINRQDKTIHMQDALVTSGNETIDNLTDTIFDLKRKDAKNTQTLAYFKEVTNIRVDTLEVPYVTPVTFRKFSDSIESNCKDLLVYIRDSTIKVPSLASYKSPYLVANMMVQKKSVSVWSFVVPDTLQLRFVEKGGFLKRKTIEVQYFHSNPFIQTTSANSVFYKPKRSFFTRVILPVAVGLGAGLIISNVK